MSKDGKEDKSDPKNWPSSVTDPIPREKLNKDLQKIVDRSDDWMDELYQGECDTHNPSFLPD
jgi:hypothetical protein